MNIKVATRKLSRFIGTSFFLLPIIYCLLVLSCVSSQVEVEEEIETEKPQVSDAKKYYSFGREYLKNEMYDEAIKNFEHAIEESVSCVDAYVNLGLAYRAKRDYVEMERVYKELIEVAPAKGHYALGGVYTNEKKYEKALSEYKEALKTDSSYVDALYGLGYVYEKIGDSQSAINEYLHALTLDPKNEGIRYSLGKAYISNEQYEKGIKELKILKESHPEDLDVRRALGSALNSIEDYKFAKEEFEYITTYAPSDIISRVNLGKAFQGLKEYDNAVQSYKEAISIDTTNISLYCHLIGLHIELKNLNKADQLLKTALQINPDDQLLHYLSGTVLVNKGDELFNRKEYSASISNYNKAIVEYKLVIKGDDLSLADNAKKAIKSVESKLKRAKEEKWWH